MVLINPLHAALPLLPQEASPYSPSSRRYLNPLYLRIEELPGAARLEQDLQRLATLGHALNEDRHIDRDRVFRLKQEAFQLLWSCFDGDSDFERFRTAEGSSLHQFAVFCVLAEEHGANWRQWPLFYRRPDSPDVERFAHEHADRVRFHEWLQWLLNQQLARAAEPVSLMQDLPVGFSPDGADAWVWQDLIAADMTIGAPPDLYSPDGQDWGLPPFIPHKLREVAYEPFIQTIRAVLRHAGGLRIDHVMGLFRLWWVPKARKPKDGAYVRYHAEDLLAIIAIESQRVGAVVVGEDLGTVEAGVREKLADHNVLSYRLLWFEKTPPSQYPEKALAAITTHDLPTLAGVWTGADLETQRRLGLNPDESASQKFREKLLETSELDADADVDARDHQNVRTTRPGALGHRHGLNGSSLCRRRTSEHAGRGREVSQLVLGLTTSARRPRVFRASTQAREDSQPTKRNADAAGDLPCGLKSPRIGFKCAAALHSTTRPPLSSIWLNLESAICTVRPCCKP